MLLSVAIACLSTKGQGDSDTGDSGFLYHDTSPAPTDTAETGETGADTGETGDTDPADTGGPDIAALDVYPDGMIVHVGATWELRVVSTQLDGSRGDDPGATFTSGDSAIATVDSGGVVTAVAPGAVFIDVSLGGLAASHSVQVRDDGVATVTVVDARDGTPIADARVALPSTEGVRTDASGVASLPVPDGGAITFTVFVDDEWNAATVCDVVGRSFTVPIWPKDSDPRSATMYGTVDFSGVADPTWEELAVGFASASVQGALATVRLDDLFAEDRTITVIGIEVDAPSNLFVEGAQEDYYATALPDTVGVWGLAGPIAIAEAGDSLNGTGDALALLVDHLDVMSWTWNGPTEAAAGAETTLGLAPATPFDATLTLPLPALSLGFQGTEELFVLVTEERADVGFVSTGLGLGNGEVSVETVASGSVSDSLGTSALIYGQVGGLGSGGATSASVARERSDGSFDVPDLPDVAAIEWWDPATHDLTWNIDEDAHFVRLRFVDNRQRIHDVYAPSDWSGTVPNAVNDFAFAQADLELVSVETEDGAYEGWMAEGELDPDGLTSAHAVSRVLQEQ